MKQILGLVFCGLFWWSLQDINAVLLPVIFFAGIIICFDIFEFLMFNLPVLGLLMLIGSAWIIWSSLGMGDYGVSLCGLGGILMAVGIVWIGKLK